MKPRFCNEIEGITSKKILKNHATLIDSQREGIVALSTLGLVAGLSSAEASVDLTLDSADQASHENVSAGNAHKTQGGPRHNVANHVGAGSPRPKIDQRYGSGNPTPTSNDSQNLWVKIAPVPSLIVDTHTPSLHAPTIEETSRDLPPVKQAGISWVAIVGIGIIQLIARRKGNNAKGRPLFDISLLFANHRSVAIGEVVLNANGSLSRTNADDASFQGPEGQKLGNASVALDPTTNRLSVYIPDGGVLEVGIEVNQGTLTAAARNAGYAGDTAPLMLIHETAAAPPPHVVNITRTAPQGIASGSGFRSRYEIMLSNGDIIFLSIVTKHHGRGDYKIESAQLHRFSGDVENREDLTVTKGDRGTGGTKTISFASETGDTTFELRATMPSGGSGDGATFDEACFTFKIIPPTKYQAGVQKPGSVESEVASLVHASQESAIVPTSETAYNLLSSWDNAGSGFVLTGEIGGVTISQEAPLVIRGSIKNGEFIPELDANHRQSVAVAGKVKNGTDRIQVLDLTLGKTGDDYVLEMRLAKGGKMIIPMHGSGSLFGFGSVETTVQDAMRTRSFNKLEIGATAIATSTSLITDDNGVVENTEVEPREITWQTAPDDIHKEISRFMSRVSGPWDFADVVMVAAENPDLIRVLLDDDQELVLRRSLEGGLIRYTVVNDPDSDHGVEGLLAQKSGSPVLGGFAVTNKTATTITKPWRGTLAQTDEDEDEIRFMDLFNGSLEVAYNKTDPSLSFYLSHFPNSNSQRGYLTSIRQNGHTALVFEMEDGNIVNIQGPAKNDETDLLMALDMPEESQSRDILAKTKLIILDHRGNTLHDVALTTEAGKVSADLDGTFEITILSEKGETGLHLQKRKVIEKPAPAPSPTAGDDIAETIEEPTNGIVPAGSVAAAGTATDTDSEGSETGSEASPDTGTTGTTGTSKAGGLSPASGARTDLKDLKDFPYEAGAFAMPSRATRHQMRRVFSPNKPHEGETASFEFYGGLHSPDGEQRADVILARMRRFGSNTKSYFDWIISADMIFRRGRWIPNLDGVLHAERYIAYPRTSRGRRGGRSEARVLLHEKSGDYPVHLGTSGNFWHLDSGNNTTLNPFRVDVTHDRNHFSSPDFALSFGKPTAKAQNTFRDVETATTKSDPKSFLPTATAPLRIETELATHKVPVTPRFGEAIYRRHMDSADGLQYIEFAPGYADTVPNRLFSQLSGDDGNGFSWRVIFEHSVKDTGGAGSSVSAVEINGQRINPDQLNEIKKPDGTAMLIGQAKIPAVSGRDTPDETIKLSVSYEERGGVFNIHSLSIGAIDIEISGFHFQPSTWGEREIFAPREGHELNVTVTRVMGRPNTGRPKLPQGPARNPQAIAAYLPDNVQALSQGANAMGGPLEHTYPDGIIPVAYRLPATAENGAETSLGLRLRYNDKLGVYEPIENPGAISVMIDGELVDAELHQTDTGRNWQITLDSGESFYLGNFYTRHGNVANGRPTPILWSTSGRDPSRHGVVHALSKMGAIDKPQAQELPQSSDPFELTISAAGQTYTLPARAIQHPGTNRVLVVPIGPARQLGDGATSVVHYYQSRRGDMPEAIEIDGFAFELQVVTKTGAPKLVIHRSTPGASSLYTDNRARNSVRLEPEDQSALILLDLNEEQFDTVIQEALAAHTETPGTTNPILVRRSLWDAISGNTYEFVYDVVADSHGHPKLAFLGLARITESGAEVLAVDAHEHRGRLYVRTAAGNHYLSHNLYPGLSLSVSSHGRTVRRELLSRPWEIVPLRDDIFSSQPVPTPDIHIDDKKYYSHSANRARARDEITRWAGLEPDLFWNWDVEFLRGLQWGYKVTQGNPTFTYRRQGGDFEFETEFDGHRPRGLVVRFRGMPIPARVHRGIAGRSYIALEGPFSGVLFYIDTHFNINELSHPVLRAQLVSDLGFAAMDRHRNRVDWSYPDPETDANLKAVLDRQVARVRTEQGTQVNLRDMVLDSASIEAAISAVYGTDVVTAAKENPDDFSSVYRAFTTIVKSLLSETKTGGVVTDTTGPTVRAIQKAIEAFEAKSVWSLTPLEVTAIALEVAASVINDPYDATLAQQHLNQMMNDLIGLIRAQEPTVNPLLLRHFSDEELAAIVREILG